MNLNNLGVVVESALLAVQNDVDAIGATRGVKAAMVETNLRLDCAIAHSKSGTPILLLKTDNIGDGRLMDTL